MTAINTALAEMKKRNPPQTVEAMILSGQTVTDTDMERIQTERMKNYEGRDRIPETYLLYCDAYVKMCGQDRDGNWNQVPTKHVLMDWMQTFEEWKQEHLKPEHIQAAFFKANSENGFPVGRPGALTTTAIALKTKLTANIQPSVNTDAIEYTKKMIAQQTGETFTPVTAETLAEGRERVRAAFARSTTKHEAERRNR